MWINSRKIGDVEDFEMSVLKEVSTNDPVFEITKEEFPVLECMRTSLYPQNLCKDRMVAYGSFCFEISG